MIAREKLSKRAVVKRRWALDGCIFKRGINTIELSESDH